MPWFYRVAKVLVTILLLLLMRWQVKGRENLPRQGPLLVVANHIQLPDVPLLGVSLDRRLIFLAKENLFRYPILSYAVRLFGAIRVRRGKPVRTALREAERVLAEGLALVMFPEGTRSKNAQLRPAFPGAALIAQRSGAPILPVAITGTERIKGITWFLRRPQITVNIGHPFRLPPMNGKLTKTELVELTNLIMARIGELLPVEYRGHYAGQGKSDEIKG